MLSVSVSALAALLVLGSAHAWCSSEEYGDVSNPYPLADEISPEVFEVVFSTNIKTIDGEAAAPIVIMAMRDWAPLGADRFHSLVRDHYYKDAAFFRVVPDFMVQFGIASDPEVTEKWDTTIPDDPVLHSNTQWTVSFATAGENTRTTQIFINYADNSFLDEEGFAPFGIITSGFDTILEIFNPTPSSSDGVDQEMYTHHGNEWVLEAYPNISMIVCEEDEESEPTDIPVDEPRDLHYMLIMSVVALSVAFVAVGLLLCRNRRPSQGTYDGMRLMDLSQKSDTTTHEDEVGRQL
jgi:peptidyl-prolyl cis-trans isomerase A (cyclophilin A)